MVRMLRNQARCLVRVASWAFSAVLIWVLSAASLSAQFPDVHYMHAGAMPPGAIGSQQLQRGGPLAGYFQPVEIIIPPGAQVATASNGQFEEPQPGPVQVGMLIGAVYRLRLTNIPDLESLEVFPTIEVIDRLYPPVGLEGRFPITIEITQEELQLAIAGKFVTRVVYLENPEDALAVDQQPRQQEYFEVAKGENPLDVADRLGRPMAIVRLGGRLPDAAGPDQAFLFGSPPFLRYRMPAKAAAIEGSADKSESKPKTSVASVPTDADLDALPVAPVTPRTARFRKAGFCDTADAAQEVSAESAERLLAQEQHPMMKQTALLILAMLGLCSCRAGAWPSGGANPPRRPPRHDLAGPQTLPPEAFTGAPGDGMTVAPNGLPIPPTARFGIPLPKMLITPWAPPGITLPWPKDEYLADGGDRDAQVRVTPDWQVHGLELEDTIAHYDTLDGRTLVEPSNRVHIYAPRFAAVRHVEEAAASEQRDGLSSYGQKMSLEERDEHLPATTSVQPVQPIGDIGIKQASLARLEQAEAVFSNRRLVAAVQDRLLPFEDFQIVRIGVYDDAEKAQLEEAIAGAIVWSKDQAMQVIIDRQMAVVETGDQRAEATFRVDLPDNPRLRVIKMASTDEARPGDVIDFTIRFDNMGNAAIGNVTLIDNLTTRLEYVADSAKSSRDAEFSTQPNEGDSLVLRWEFAEPLEPNQGGVVRFQCRVR